METIPYRAESYQSDEFELPDEPVETDTRLEPCPICTRTFAPKTLKKHVVICEKTVTKKRKVFDSSRQRREGTDLADFLPRNFGLPPAKQEPKSSPTEKVIKQVTTPVLQRKDVEPVKTVTPTFTPTVTHAATLPPKKTVSPTSNPSTIPREKPKPVLSRLVAAAQPCPHCGRSFGSKAYDRHVEWCKEKSRLSNAQHAISTNVAKERLQARTKYRAPCLKTKRAVNREKYSGLSCEESTNSLSDGGSIGSACKSKEFSQEFRGNMDVSMTSSVMSTSVLSDGGFSDKYDPFLSAQRQLEELCSPTDSAPPTTSLPTTPYVKNSPETFMSKSFTGNATVNKLNTVKSNFHRTLSLRVPRKTTPTRTIFPASTKQKPTIQRGISDEGPISNNFLKPEEYDEMPVKSVCINDFATNRQLESHSTPKIIRRDPQANRNRRNLKMNLMPSVGKKDINPLSKTDSLAIFLHYENATRAPDILPSLTEKDLKDKSNNLSKQTSSKSSASDLDSIFTDKEKLCSLKNSLSNLLDSAHTSGVEGHLTRETNHMSVTKLQAIKLDPLPKLLPKSERPDFNPFPVISKDNDFIDPKLINVCDNLPINVTKLSDNDLTSSSTESMEKTALQTESRFEVAERPEDSPLNLPVVHRNSTEKRNLLKRQLRLGKNQFLYDLSPDNDNNSGICNTETIDATPDSNKLESSTSTIDPVPDEFDIEEFISSFENAEEYPLFKDYKAFLSNRSLNKLSNNSRELSRSPTTASRNQNDEEDDHEIEKNEIFSSNESFLKHECETLPYSPACHAEQDSPKSSVKLTDLNDLNDNICNRRRTVSRSDNEDEDEDEREICGPDINKNLVTEERSNEHSRFDSMNSNHDVTDNVKDLSKPSSLESLEIKKSVSSKQSADSAYGSLSRYSPVERMSRRTSALRSTVPDTHNESQSEKRNITTMQSKRRSRDLSNDSSSSEISITRGHHQDRILHTPDFGSKQDHRMSKFCHECGSKFIVAQAKFCMECGVKRIVLD